MALSLYMSKAYDRVDQWSFVCKIMEKSGFLSHWQKLILDCTSTSHFGFCINRFVRGKVILSWS